MSYKAVIQHWQAGQNSGQGGARPPSAGIPPIIGVCEKGAVGPSNYAALRSDPTFLYRCVTKHPNPLLGLRPSNP